MTTAYSNQVVGFTKLFSTIIHSTVWRTEMHVKVVWVTLLAMADRNGRVWASIPGLADASRVSLGQCLSALSVLAEPDEWSRTKTDEGRRIKEIEGGWELLNYLKYRERRDEEERRVQTRQAVARHREKKADVSQRKPRKPMKAQAEAEAEAEAERVQTPAASSPRESAQAVIRRGKDAGRIFLHRWQLDALISTLGPHADAFFLDEWIDGLTALLDAKGLTLPAAQRWPWVQAELTAEIQRRGLPIAHIANALRPAGVGTVSHAWSCPHTPQCGNRTTCAVVSIRTP